MVSENKNNGYSYFKHQGSFLLLLFVSVFRPASIWPNIPFSFAPVTVLICGLLLIYKIHVTIGFSKFVENFKTELSLVLAYQTLCVVSLFLNFHRYEDFGQFYQWGITFPIVQFTLPMAAFLFVLPESHSRFSLSMHRFSWVVLVLLLVFAFGLALWQKIDFRSANSLTTFFLSGVYERSSNVRSIFAISTDLAAISVAILMLCSSLSFYYLRIEKHREAIISFMLLSLVIWMGLISGERVFLLGCLTALTCCSVFLLRTRFRGLIPLMLAISPVVFYLTALFIPAALSRQFINILPAVYKINSSLPLSASDFLPRFDNVALSGRIELWGNALKATSENLWLGISNGGFRLLKVDGEYIHFFPNNTHNLFVQGLTDAGLPGLFLILLLVYRILSHAKGNLALFIATLAVGATLMVDNFTDHSLPWIIVVTYCLAMLHHLGHLFTNKMSRRCSP